MTGAKDLGHNTSTFETRRKGQTMMQSEPSSSWVPNQGKAEKSSWRKWPGCWRMNSNFSEGKAFQERSREFKNIDTEERVASYNFKYRRNFKWWKRYGWQAHRRDCTSSSFIELKGINHTIDLPVSGRKPPFYGRTSLTPLWLSTGPWFLHRKERCLWQRCLWDCAWS